MLPELPWTMYYTDIIGIVELVSLQNNKNADSKETQNADSKEPQNEDVSSVLHLHFIFIILFQYDILLNYSISNNTSLYCIGQLYIIVPIRAGGKDCLGQPYCILEISPNILLMAGKKTFVLLIHFILSAKDRVNGRRKTDCFSWIIQAFLIWIIQALICIIRK